MMEKVLSLLGLMKKAGAIACGEDNSIEAVREGKGKLLVLASDASDTARRRADSLCSGRKLIKLELRCTKAELAWALGMSSCSMAAICDLGFAAALVKELGRTEPGRYDEISALLQQRYDKARRRKAEKRRRGGMKSKGIKEDNI